jgi:hypothetical protein
MGVTVNKYSTFDLELDEVLDFIESSSDKDFKAIDDKVRSCKSGNKSVVVIANNALLIESMAAEKLQELIDMYGVERVVESVNL